MNYRETAKKVKEASIILGALPEADRNRALQAIGRALMEHKEEIFAANRQDLEKGADLPAPILGRLKFDDHKLQDVVAGIEGGCHLQLVVEVEVHVLIDGLFVDDAFGIVLIVGILKLTERHGLTVDRHDDRIVLLWHRRSTANRRDGGENEGRDKDILFHRFNRWDGYNLVPLM